MPLEAAMTTASPSASQRPSWARRRAGVGSRSVHEFEGRGVAANDAERCGSFEVLKRQLPHLSGHRQPFGLKRLRELYLMVVGVLAPGATPGHQHRHLTGAQRGERKTNPRMTDDDTGIGDGLHKILS
jgi:hypothetical protein